MRIAMIGTRGVPARYGGFETAVEEIGQRLAARGHSIVVYCRGNETIREHLGMERVLLPAVRHVSLETLSHSLLSVCHSLFHRPDVALLFNAANAPVLPLLQLRRIPTALHVDGLEWKRSKWGPTGRKYYLLCERFGTKAATELIADAVGIRDYYQTKYGASSVYVPYGAAILHMSEFPRLSDLGLLPRSFHLVVARLEPENNVHLTVEGYIHSDAKLPLVIVGSVPYERTYQKELRALAAGDPRIRMLGPIWDQDLLDNLYAGCATYLHGHSVGGTNPSLLRAMGAGAPIIALDVTFNREVLGETGHFITDPCTLSQQLILAEKHPDARIQRGELSRQRAQHLYDWDSVTDSYEDLCSHLAGTALPTHDLSLQTLPPQRSVHGTDISPRDDLDEPAISLRDPALPQPDSQALN